MKKFIKINIPVISFAAGIAIFIFLFALSTGCSTPEPAEAVVDSLAVEETFIHPDSSIAAEMEIKSTFDSLK